MRGKTRCWLFTGNFPIQYYSMGNSTLQTLAAAGWCLKKNIVSGQMVLWPQSSWASHARGTLWTFFFDSCLQQTVKRTLSFSQGQHPTCLVNFLRKSEKTFISRKPHSSVSSTVNWPFVRVSWAGFIISPNLGNQTVSSVWQVGVVQEQNVSRREFGV